MLVVIQIRILQLTDPVLNVLLGHHPVKDENLQPDFFLTQKQERFSSQNTSSCYTYWQLFFFSSREFISKLYRRTYNIGDGDRVLFRVVKIFVGFGG